MSSILRATQVVGKLQSHYWLVAEVEPNRHHLDVVWSAASDLVVVNHTFRWDCRAFEAVRISEGKTGARLDLKKALDARLRQHFKTALPRGSASRRVTCRSFSPNRRWFPVKHSWQSRRR